MGTFSRDYSITKESFHHHYRREKYGCDNCSKHFRCVHVCVACMNACVCVCVCVCVRVRVHCAHAQTLKKGSGEFDIVSLLPGLPIIITCFEGIELLQERIRTGDLRGQKEVGL